MELRAESLEQRAWSIELEGEKVKAWSLEQRAESKRLKAQS